MPSPALETAAPPRTEKLDVALDLKRFPFGLGKHIANPRNHRRTIPLFISYRS